eukprot:TRINITY_DN101528_c0_g1_i1.p1 TRINITY_DN101528_c0_g1~~TRINITY_DN101528_c0_g1_i1.p1  ORF type:complete len:261 (-),score=56.00 TRINITY_DN101528_c0_g1_i1:126-908(-)
MAPEPQGGGAVLGGQAPPAKSSAGPVLSKAQWTAKGNASIHRLNNAPPHRQFRIDNHPGDASKAVEAINLQIGKELRHFKSFNLSTTRGSLSKSKSQPLGSTALPSLTGTSMSSSSRSNWYAGLPVQIMGMAHRLELEGAHGEVVDPVPDEQGRLRVLLVTTADGSAKDGSKVMRIMTDRLCPKKPMDRPRNTETSWFGDPTRIVPTNGYKTAVPDELKMLERQAQISADSVQFGTKKSLCRRAFVRTQLGGSFAKDDVA